MALVTSQKFEGADEFANITGNFDGAGLTCGALGWTIKWDNQDPLVNAFIARHGEGRGVYFMPTTWSEYMGLIRASGETGVHMAAKWTNGKSSNVKEPYRSELRAFWRSPEMRAIQVEFADKDMGAYAEKIGSEFCNQYGIPLNQKVFAWFFDLKVHNGGMSDARMAMAQGYNWKRLEDWSDGLQIPSNFAATKRDLIRNCDVWDDMYQRGELMLWEKDLIGLSQIRANMSRTEFKADTCNRKGTIAAGKGWVHGSFYDFQKGFDEADGPKAPPGDAAPVPTSPVDGAPVSPSTQVSEGTHIRTLLTLAGLHKDKAHQLVSMREAMKKGYPRYWAFVNMGTHSATKRMTVVDVQGGNVTRHLCAHGIGSEGSVDDGIADKFSNVSGSNATSLGIYKCAEVYQGKYGTSMRLDGLSPTNTNARERAIVLHGADYASEAFARIHGRIGRSQGCPAVPMAEKDSIIARLQGGSLMLIDRW